MFTKDNKHIDYVLDTTPLKNNKWIPNTNVQIKAYSPKNVKDIDYFYDGKKEDWIYWISLLNLNPQLVYLDSVNFIYNIFNVSDHYDKKWRSFIELRTILVEKLKWNTFLSYPISLLHIALASCRWIYLRILNQIN